MSATAKESVVPMRIPPRVVVDQSTRTFWTPPILATPILSVPGLDDAKPIVLKSVIITAKVTGFLSRTSVSMTFFNPHDKVLEGELEFPLPEGATVSGYGLDVTEDGVNQIVDAVIVEKKKARQVFEAEVRKGVDPGLVEFKKGNMFTTRVYPLPAHGTRTIKLDYVSELVSDSAGRQYYFHPLNIKNEVDFKLDVEIVVSGTDELPVFATEELSGVVFTPEPLGAGTNNFHLIIEEKGWKFQESTSAITIEVPRPEQKGAVFYVEASPMADEKDEFYFAIQDWVPPTKTKDAEGKVERIAVFWDASMSRAKNDIAREIGLLQQIVEAKVSSSGAVDLYIFRNILEKKVEFAASKLKELAAHLKELPLDGATRIDCLKLEDDKESKSVAFCLLFSDGMNSVGGDLAPIVQQPVCPVHIVTGTGKANNASLLKHYAFSTGGMYFDLSKTKDESVLSSVGKPQFSLVSASGKHFDHVLPNGIMPLISVSADSGQYCTIVGRITKPCKASLKLDYGYSQADIVQSVTHELDTAVASNTGLIALLWAQQAVATLSALPDKYAEEILNLGKRFSIVTPGTSLLVLETLDQHVEHEIEPAPSRKRMWEEYRAIMAEKQEDKDRSEESKLANVSGWWDSRVKWWEKDYNYKPKEFHEEKSKKKAMSRMAAPAPSASRARRMESRADREECKEELCDEGGASDSSSGDGAGPSLSGVGVKVTAWDPQTPYIAALKAVESKGLDKLYTVYLAQRDLPDQNYGTSPAFFFDCANYFLNKREMDPALSHTLGIRILTNIPELKLEEPQLLRMLGYKLDAENQLDLAVEIFEKVLKLRPDEPQSYRDLALVLEKRGKDHYQRAVDLLWTVVIGPKWRPSFEQVEVTALVEMNALLAKAKRQKVEIKLPNRSSKFIKNLDCDLRISMGWDTDNSDFDLHVVEPSGEEAYFGHNKTESGGMVSRDFTDGYGPEEYMLKKAYPGEFKAWTNYYASHSATMTGPASIILKIFINWGRADQVEYVTLTRLQESKQHAMLGTITIPEGGTDALSQSSKSTSTETTSQPKKPALLELPPSEGEHQPAGAPAKSPRKDKCLVM